MVLPGSPEEMLLRRSGRAESSENPTGGAACGMGDFFPLAAGRRFRRFHPIRVYGSGLPGAGDRMGTDMDSFRIREERFSGQKQVPCPENLSARSALVRN